MTGEDLSAVLGNNGAELPASAAACVNCHGQDGAGNPEGGAKPSNITWQELTNPYRAHPYTAALLQRAIADGLDSAGNPLQALMPRFRVAPAGMADLTAYLRKLGTVSDPGVTAGSVNIGVVFPPGQAAGPTASAIASALRADFEDLNRAGGIYGRRVELRIAADSQSTEDFIAREQIFALVASYPGDSETNIPVAGALASDPALEAHPSPNAFYLYSGLTGQARALASFAAATHASNNSPALILYEGEALEPLADRLAAECRSRGWTHVAARALGQAGGVETSPDAVIFMGPAGAAGRLRAEAVKSAWHSDFYLPASIAGAETFPGRTFLSYPALPSAESREAETAYRQLAGKYHLPDSHIAAQWTALASADILTEGLKRAGNVLTRQRLVAAIEGLYDYRTGYTHSVTYGPHRRVGAQGAYVVETGGATKAFTVCGWIPENSGLRF